MDAYRFFILTLFFLSALAASVYGKEIQTGIYGLSASGNFSEAVKISSQNGFQLAVVAADKNQIDVLSNNNMKGLVAFWLKRETVNDEAKWQQFLITLRDKVLELKGHPAVFAWYVVDEPDGQALSIDKLSDLRIMIKLIDPVTPLFTVLDNPDKWAMYLPYFDIIAVDPYMRKKYGSYDTPEVVRDWLKKVKSDQYKIKSAKPIWVVLGAFDARPKADDVRSNYKKPTPSEFRNMVDMSMAEGVEGILVYTYAFIENDRYSAWKLPSDDLLLWNEVRKLPSMVNMQK